MDQRDRETVSDWKTRERSRFLDCLRRESKFNMVDIGSGPGTHAEYFQNHGIDVLCIDLSPAMVERCREKGLEAYALDVFEIGTLGHTFDAAYAMNSLLHVPRERLQRVLQEIRKVLNPSGLFYWGQYGGQESEGVRENDDYEPKRFFSQLEDEQIKVEASRYFDIESFQRIQFEEDTRFRFQSLILRAGERSTVAA